MRHVNRRETPPCRGLANQPALPEVAGQDPANIVHPAPSTWLPLSGVMRMRFKSVSLIHTWGSTPPVGLGRPPPAAGDRPKAPKCGGRFKSVSLNPIFLAESTHECLLVRVDPPPLGVVLIAQY
ncbi:hypothetical protein MHYP_G00072790 [Metynnis hypsauchen]